jgi:RNA binding exosome subunit
VGTTVNLTRTDVLVVASCLTWAAEDNRRVAVALEVILGENAQSNNVRAASETAERIAHDLKGQTKCASNS